MYQCKRVIPKLWYMQPAYTITLLETQCFTHSIKWNWITSRGTTVFHLLTVQWGSQVSQPLKSGSSLSHSSILIQPTKSLGESEPIVFIFQLVLQDKIIRQLWAQLVKVTKSNWFHCHRIMIPAMVTERWLTFWFSNNTPNAEGFQMIPSSLLQMFIPSRWCGRPMARVLFFLPTLLQLCREKSKQDFCR